VNRNPKSLQYRISCHIFKISGELPFQMPLMVFMFLLYKGWDGMLEAMKKARRLNNHVFSMLKARCPLEDKTACAIKQSGAPIHRIKFENTVSAFETLPQKGV
jgi:hypothetical protein